MREISTTVTVGEGSEQHNHDLEYRHTLKHVHDRENGVIELIPYRSYKDQINDLMRPYIDRYNEGVAQREAAAWDRYNSGQIKTKPRKANYKRMGYDYYTEHLNDTYFDRHTQKHLQQPMWRSLIVGLGDKSDRLEGRITEEEAIKIMTDVVDQFRKDFPYFHLLGASIHLDEEGFFHCHIDYKPLYDNPIGQGLEVGIGMEAALEKMGFKPEQSIINGRDKAPLLFNAFRNKLYRDVEAAMADQKIRLQYGVSAVKEPGKDSGRNQPLEAWQATQDTARDLQHQKNIALDVISQDEVSPEGYKSALAAIQNIENTLQQVENSPLTITRKDYKISFTLFDQMKSMIEELKKTMMHVFHQLDVDQDLLDHYIPLAEQAEASAKELAAAKAELATHQRKRALDDIIASTKQDTSWVEIFIELIFGYFHDDQEAYEEFREHKERYFSGKPNFGPMDWKIQEMLDLACGTDYAKRDKAAYFARKKAQEEEMLSKTKHKLNLENLPKGRS